MKTATSSARLNYRFWLLALLTVGIAACSTPKSKKDTVAQATEPPIKSDTIFLKRKIKKDYYHTIYIEKNREHPRYKAFLSDTIDFSRSERYQESKDAIEEDRPGIFKNHDLLGLSQLWEPVFPYKRKYYLYNPCDGIGEYTQVINPSDLFSYYYDMPPPQPLVDVKKLDDRTFQLYYIDFNSEDTPTRELRIHIIDDKTQLAVFEYMDETVDYYRYRLFVPWKYAHNYDIIVNDCRTQKEMEYDFDDLDYKALIAKSKK